MVWNGPNHLDATDLLQLADLLDRKISLAGDELLSGKTLLDDLSLRMTAVLKLMRRV